ncbi:MAG: hypothetical protein JXA15_02045 [Spirochaetales bacterium]|nr:hypothetical protein [Spirochaetales bacterium]
MNRNNGLDARARRRFAIMSSIAAFLAGADKVRVSMSCQSESTASRKQGCQRLQSAKKAAGVPRLMWIGALATMRGRSVRNRKELQSQTMYNGLHDSSQNDGHDSKK